MTLPQSVFADTAAEVWKYRWAVALHVGTLVGATPGDRRLDEENVKRHLGLSPGDEIRDHAIKAMISEGVELDQVAATVAEARVTNAFRRNSCGELYLGGYALKSAVREAACIRWPRRKWPSGKLTRGHISEHIFVLEEQLLLGVTEPSEVRARPVNTWRGPALSVEEVLYDAVISATIISDFDVDHADWAQLWSVGEKEGIGACRSRGDGVYAVTSWRPT